MEYFTVRNGKVIELTKEEFEAQEGTPVEEIVKDLSPERRAAFEKHRYENFIKPLMEHNRNKRDSLKKGIGGGQNGAY